MVNMTYGRSERVDPMHFQTWKKDDAVYVCLHICFTISLLFVLFFLLPCYLVPLFCLFLFVCVRSFVRSFVCSFVGWFVCLFVCLFVCSFVGLFVCLFVFVRLCVCCFSPFAFIFAGLQFCLFCFCSTLLRVFLFLVYFILFPMFSLCFLLAWLPPQVRIENGAWNELLWRPKDRSAWDRCLSDSCGHKWTIGYNFSLAGVREGIKRKKLVILKFNWHTALTLTSRIHPSAFRRGFRTQKHAACLCFILLHDCSRL